MCGCDMDETEDMRMTTVVKEKGGSRSKTFDMVYIAVFAVLIAICSWISIPTLVPFTMQTFALFLAVGTLGGRRGTMAVLIYLLLGAVGIPVFAEFSAGMGVLLGNTGGYLIGFIFSALLMWAMEALLGKKTWVLGLSMLLGMAVYYVFGTVWFMVVYAKNSGPIGIATVLSWCVLPFIVPDLVKGALALFLTKHLAKAVKID
jgi:Uncharacterized conserved protein